MACPELVAVEPVPSTGGAGTLRIDARPNPFNPMTTIAYELPAPGPIRISILDLRGRVVDVPMTGFQSAGRHAFTWRGRDAADRSIALGTYVLRLQTDGGETCRKITVVR